MAYRWPGKIVDARQAGFQVIMYGRFWVITEATRSTRTADRDWPRDSHRPDLSPDVNARTS